MKRKLRKIIASIYHAILVILANFCKQYFLYKIKRKEVIRIFFLVSENQKWNCDSLYWLLAGDSRFQVKIAVTKLERSSPTDHGDNIKFFQNLGYEVVDAFDFDKNKGVPLRKLKADIIFPQQPGGLIAGQNLIALFTSALLCYVPYEQVVSNNDQNHYNLVFMKILWKYFAPNEIVRNLFAKTNPITASAAAVVTGHPKMDHYKEQYKVSESVLTARKNAKKIVIYAPHHAISDTSLKYSTFLWSGPWMLDFARKRSDMHFVFKPHPRLRYALRVDASMEVADIDNYYEAWNDLPNAELHDTGDYLGLFNSSDLLITDYGSFLFEYLYANKPAIITKNVENGGLNDFGQATLKYYVQVTGNEQLATQIERILQEYDRSSLPTARQIETTLLPKGIASENIYRHLADEIFNSNLTQKNI